MQPELSLFSDEEIAAFRERYDSVFGEVLRIPGHTEVKTFLSRLPALIDQVDQLQKKYVLEREQRRFEAALGYGKALVGNPKVTDDGTLIDTEKEQKAIAKLAVGYADALLDELEKPREQP